MFIWLYSLMRFIVEFYRFGDPQTAEGSSIVLWNIITVAQVASLVLAFVSMLLMQDLKRRLVLSKLLEAGGAEETVEEETEEDVDEDEEEGGFEDSLESDKEEGEGVEQESESEDDGENQGGIVCDQRIE